MKKVLFAMMAAAMMVSCGNKTQQTALASGAKYFIGGHGGLAEKAQVEFKIAYLEKVKELMAANKDAAAFTEALKAAYPELPGDADALAQALYKK